MAKDKDYRQMINTAQWRRLRHDVLTRHPLCQQCEEEGRITPAREVHHVTPVEYGASRMDKQRLMFNPHNLRALCHDCHVRAHVEMGRSGKAATRRRVEAQVAAMNVKFFNKK